MIKKEKANAPHNCKIAIYHLQVTIGVAISVFFFFFFQSLIGDYFLQS